MDAKCLRMQFPSLSNGQWERKSTGTCALDLYVDGNILDEYDRHRQNIWTIEKSHAFVADWKGAPHLEATVFCQFSVAEEKRLTDGRD